jgi:hypothetical protein
VTTLESTAANFNVSFTEWKPQVKDSVHSVKLELSKLNSYFNRDAKEASNMKLSILQVKSVHGRPLVKSTADGPSGHRVEQFNWDCGYGDVCTLTHDPVKGTIYTLPPLSQHTPQIESTFPKDQFRQWPQQSASSRVQTGRLSKLNFPKFEGENPELWKSRCENYFEMYEVDEGIWVKIALMHFEVPAACWTATWSELYSCIHERFSRDEHELLSRQLYKKKQVGFVQEYIDKFCELVDQLHAYNSNVEPLYYITRFIDGLKNDIKYFIVVQRPKDLDTICCLPLLHEEHGAIQPKELKVQGTGLQPKSFLKGVLPLPPPPITNKTDFVIRDKTKTNGTKGQSVENKIAALATYRMAKGLCRKCGEKWYRGHQCADSIHSNVL